MSETTDSLEPLPEGAQASEEKEMTEGKVSLADVFFNGGRKKINDSLSKSEHVGRHSYMGRRTLPGHRKPISKQPVTRTSAKRLHNPLGVSEHGAADLRYRRSRVAVRKSHSASDSKKDNPRKDEESEDQKDDDEDGGGKKKKEPSKRQTTPAGTESKRPLNNTGGIEEEIQFRRNRISARKKVGPPDRQRDSAEQRESSKDMNETSEEMRSRRQRASIRRPTSFRRKESEDTEGVTSSRRPGSFRRKESVVKSDEVDKEGVTSEENSKDETRSSRKSGTLRRKESTVKGEGGIKEKESDSNGENSKDRTGSSGRRGAETGARRSRGLGKAAQNLARRRSKSGDAKSNRQRGRISNPDSATADERQETTRDTNKSRSPRRRSTSGDRRRASSTDRQMSASSHRRRARSTDGRTSSEAPNSSQRVERRGTRHGERSRGSRRSAPTAKSPRVRKGKRINVSRSSSSDALPITSPFQENDEEGNALQEFPENTKGGKQVDEETDRIETVLLSPGNNGVLPENTETEMKNSQEEDEVTEMPKVTRYTPRTFFGLVPMTPSERKSKDLTKEKANRLVKTELGRSNHGKSVRLTMLKTMAKFKSFNKLPDDLSSVNSTELTGSKEDTQGKAEPSKGTTGKKNSQSLAGLNRFDRFDAFQDSGQLSFDMDLAVPGQTLANQGGRNMTAQKMFTSSSPSSRQLTSGGSNEFRSFGNFTGALDGSSLNTHKEENLDISGSGEDQNEQQDSSKFDCDFGPLDKPQSLDTLTEDMTTETFGDSFALPLSTLHSARDSTSKSKESVSDTEKAVAPGSDFSGANSFNTGKLQQLLDASGKVPLSLPEPSICEMAGPTEGTSEKHAGKLEELLDTSENRASTLAEPSICDIVNRKVGGSNEPTGSLEDLLEATGEQPSSLAGPSIFENPMEKDAVGQIGLLSGQDGQPSMELAEPSMFESGNGGFGKLQSLLNNAEGKFHANAKLAEPSVCGTINEKTGDQGKKLQDILERGKTLAEPSICDLPREANKEKGKPLPLGGMLNSGKERKALPADMESVFDAHFLDENEEAPTPRVFAETEAERIAHAKDVDAKAAFLQLELPGMQGFDSDNLGVMQHTFTSEMP